MPIYVETCIHGPMEELWRLTQTPESHVLWDLRFTSIEYLQRAGPDGPQRFRYATRIGFGSEIDGWGETVGERSSGGARSSSLKFGSDDRRSLIRSGTGYWKYEPAGDHVRFITGYDYDVRWGVFGRVLDRIALRPLLGWATAWSFDRLRLWIEDGAEPRRMARQALIHGLAAAGVAFVWMWHGLVPKLAGPHPDEIAMLLEAGVPHSWTSPVIYTLGAVELLFGLLFLPLSYRRWPWLFTIAVMIVATIGVSISSPERTLGPFSPITLNVLLAILAAVGLLSLRGLPCASRCLRRAPESGRRESRL